MADCRFAPNPPYANMIFGGKMPDYRRSWVTGRTYFFTVNLLERKRNLLVTEIELYRVKQL